MPLTLHPGWAPIIHLFSTTFYLYNALSWSSTGDVAVERLCLCGSQWNTYVELKALLCQCSNDPHREAIFFLSSSTVRSEVRVTNRAASLEVEANTSMFLRGSHCSVEAWIDWMAVCQQRGFNPLSRLNGGLCHHCRCLLPSYTLSEPTVMAHMLVKIGSAAAWVTALHSP